MEYRQGFIHRRKDRWRLSYSSPPRPMAYRSTSFRRSLARKTMVPHNWQCPYLPIYVVASNMHKTKQRAPLDQRVLHNNIFTRVIFHASNLISRMCCLATLSVALIFCRESLCPHNNPAIHMVILILLY